MVERSGEARWLGPDDALALAPAAVVAIDHSFARQDWLVRERAAVALDRLRRGGATILVSSHEEALLLRLAMKSGGWTKANWPAAATLRKSSRPTASTWPNGCALGAIPFRSPLSPRMRRGDGRAEVLSISTLGEDGRATSVWRCGELAVVKVRVRFSQAVADPVVGMLIRTRIGLNVYGTNTELERLKLGPVEAGDTLEVTFAFRCELCPQEYTLTAASHDPDGVWHDWLEDAVAFSVSDSRYTAGVANLRAQVSWTKHGGTGFSL